MLKADQCTQYVMGTFACIFTITALTLCSSSLSSVNDTWRSPQLLWIRTTFSFSNIFKQLRMESVDILSPEMIRNYIEPTCKHTIRGNCIPYLHSPLSTVAVISLMQIFTKSASSLAVLMRWCRDLAVAQ